MLGQGAFEKASNLMRAVNGPLKILEIDPEHVEALELLAFTLAADEQFQEALEYIDKAIAIDPDTK